MARVSRPARLAPRRAASAVRDSRPHPIVELAIALKSEVRVCFPRYDLSAASRYGRPSSSGVPCGGAPALVEGAEVALLRRDQRRQGEVVGDPVVALAGFALGPADDSR